jgi:hypothetical protein
VQTKSPWDGYTPSGIAVDIHDNLWLAGTLSSTWLTLKSADGGATYTLVDSYQGDVPAHGKKLTAMARAQGIAAGPSGEIYVVGANNTSTETWIVRKSANGGSSWGIVDTFQLASGPSSTLAKWTSLIINDLQKQDRVLALHFQVLDHRLISSPARLAAALHLPLGKLCVLGPAIDCAG